MDASLSTVMRMMYAHRLTCKPKFFGQSVFWRYWQIDTAQCQKYTELVWIKPGLRFGLGGLEFRVKVRP